MQREGASIYSRPTQLERSMHMNPAPPYSSKGGRPGGPVISARLADRFKVGLGGMAELELDDEFPLFLSHPTPPPLLYIIEVGISAEPIEL
jgi:hypothetical protein